LKQRIRDDAFKTTAPVYRVVWGRAHNCLYILTRAGAQARAVWTLGKNVLFHPCFNRDLVNTSQKRYHLRLLCVASFVTAAVRLWLCCHDK